MNGKRIWHPFTFTARSARTFRVSFLVAEEATWDHRYHDLDGNEIAAGGLDLTRTELRLIQVGCDGAVNAAPPHPAMATWAAAMQASA